MKTENIHGFQDLMILGGKVSSEMTKSHFCRVGLTKKQKKKKIKQL